jgi:hypothetical protein
MASPFKKSMNYKHLVGMFIPWIKESGPNQIILPCDPVAILGGGAESER